MNYASIDLLGAPLCHNMEGIPLRMTISPSRIKKKGETKRDHTLEKSIYKIVHIVHHPGPCSGSGSDIENVSTELRLLSSPWAERTKFGSFRSGFL